MNTEEIPASNEQFAPKGRMVFRSDIGKYIEIPPANPMKINYKEKAKRREKSKLARKQRKLQRKKK